MKNIEKLKKVFLNYLESNREEGDGFKSFKDPGDFYNSTEYNYKHEASDIMRALFKKWVDGGSDDLTEDEFMERLRTLMVKKLPKSGWPQNLTNWRDHDHIFREALQEKGTVRAFMNYLHPLLKSEEKPDDMSENLQNLLGWMQGNNFSPGMTKSFPSLLLYFWNPKRYVFIKPSVYDRFMKNVQEKPLGQGVYLTAEMYQSVLDNMEKLRKELSDLEPRDMIDLHSFYYLVTVVPEEEPPKGPENDSRVKREPPVDLPLNLILYGPPGTGKTYALQTKYAPLFADRYVFVTFHQSYSYEEFVEGIRPTIDQTEDSGRLVYCVFDGVFKQAVSRARKDPEGKHAILIDEINRANISKVFGELITLIEPDKRMTWNAEKGIWEGGIQVQLPYTHSQDPDAPLFGVPDNLYIIGTMNTADRSIALLDTALRRRFVFREMMPQSGLLTKKVVLIPDSEEVIELEKLLDAMNDRIEFLFDRDHRIGHSYFMNIQTYDQLEKLFLNRIIPMLQEYFYDDFEKIQMVFNDLEADEADTDGKPKARENAIISHRIPGLRSLLGASSRMVTPRRIYDVPEQIQPESILKIYQ